MVERRRFSSTSQETISAQQLAAQRLPRRRFAAGIDIQKQRQQIQQARVAEEQRAIQEEAREEAQAKLKAAETQQRIYEQEIQKLRTTYEGQVQPYQKGILTPAQYEQLKQIAAQIQHENLSQTVSSLTATEIISEQELIDLRSKAFLGDKEAQARLERVKSYIPEGEKRGSAVTTFDIQTELGWRAKYGDEEAKKALKMIGGTVSVGGISNIRQIVERATTDQTFRNLLGGISETEAKKASIQFKAAEIKSNISELFKIQQIKEKVKSTEFYQGFLEPQVKNELEFFNRLNRNFQIVTEPAFKLGEKIGITPESVGKKTESLFGLTSFERKFLTTEQEKIVEPVLSRLGSFGGGVAEYTLKDIREKPAKQFLLLSTGAGIASLSSGVVSTASAIGGATASKITSGALKTGGAVLTTAYLADIGIQAAVAQTPRESGRILGVAAKDLALVGYGTRFGGKSFLTPTTSLQPLPRGDSLFAKVKLPKIKAFDKVSNLVQARKFRKLALSSLDRPQQIFDVKIKSLKQPKIKVSLDKTDFSFRLGQARTKARIKTESLLKGESYLELTKQGTITRTTPKPSVLKDFPVKRRITAKLTPELKNIMQSKIQSQVARFKSGADILSIERGGIKVRLGETPELLKFLPEKAIVGKKQALVTFEKIPKVKIDPMIRSLARADILQQKIGVGRALKTQKTFKQFRIKEPDLTGFKQIVDQRTGLIQLQQTKQIPKTKVKGGLSQLQAQASMQLELSLPRQQTQQIFNLRQRTDVLFGERQEAKQRQWTLQTFKMNQLSKQKPAQKISFAQPQKYSLSQITSFVQPQRVSLSQAQKFITPKIQLQKKIPEKEKIGGILLLGTGKAPKKAAGLFTVQEKRFGKFRNIGKSPSLSKAVLFGARKVSMDLGATFRVKGGFGGGYRLPKTFKRKKGKALTFTEIPSARLSSIGEISEIQFAKRQKLKL